MLGPQRARRASWAVARYPAVWALTLGKALEMIQQTLLTQRHMQNRGVVAPLLLSVDNGREAMALEVRRIVTGHDASGKAIIKTDDKIFWRERCKSVLDYQGPSLALKENLFWIGRSEQKQVLSQAWEFLIGWSIPTMNHL